MEDKKEGSGLASIGEVRSVSSSCFGDPHSLPLAGSKSMHVVAVPASLNLLKLESPRKEREMELELCRYKDKEQCLIHQNALSCETRTLRHCTVKLSPRRVS